MDSFVYCKFCPDEKIIDHPEYESTRICPNCKTRYYGLSYRIICEHKDSFYWFYMDHIDNKTYMFRRRDNTIAGDKIAEWNGILALTPFNVKRRIETLITFS